MGAHQYQPTPVRSMDAFDDETAAQLVMFEARAAQIVEKSKQFLEKYPVSEGEVMTDETPTWFRPFVVGLCIGILMHWTCKAVE